MNVPFLGADPGYIPQPTSYDYDAPISESGKSRDAHEEYRSAILASIRGYNFEIYGHSYRHR